MGKKRKPVGTSHLDEVDRTIYSTFCSAANSLSQLYSQALNQQKLTFHAGERHGLEKIYQWILRQHEGGSRVNTGDILAYLQTELDYCGEEPSMSPRAPHQNQHSQMTMQLTNSGFSVSSFSSGAPNVEQSKNSVFSNALSSPVCQSLQNYHLSEGGHYPNNGGVQSSENGSRNNEPNFSQHHLRDSNSFNSNDYSMDMHADSPDRE